MTVSHVSAHERGPRAAAAGNPLVKVEGLHKSFNHMGNVLEVLGGIDLDITAPATGRAR